MSCSPSRARLSLSLPFALLAGCSDPVIGQTPLTAGSSLGTGTDGDDETSDSSSNSASDSSDPKFDLGDTGGAEGGACFNPDETDVDECEEQAPPDSFEPEVQWEWSGIPPYINSDVTPLVANLTDDNGDGVVDICDTPDIVVVIYDVKFQPGLLVALDGETGAVHWTNDEAVVTSATQPALGDIDGDGSIEIVTIKDGTMSIVEADGTTHAIIPGVVGGRPALVDLDGDGEIEIVTRGGVYQIDGSERFVVDTEGGARATAPVAADLDGDGLLEVSYGAYAHREDGSLYYENQDLLDTHGLNSWVQIADIDADADPEILVSDQYGIHTLDHTGQTLSYGLRPNGEPEGSFSWRRGFSVHDFDGDGEPEYGFKARYEFLLLETDGTILWSRPVDETSTGAIGVGFDFLGDGIAEVVFAGEEFLHVFDGQTGAPLLQVSRSSYTSSEYPTVADVDNDGSAEIVVVSNTTQAMQIPDPAVRVIRDREDRWIPARRIWNQHAYHVTNVLEDGSIPAQPVPNWLDLNTYRTQAQISDDGICVPPPVP